MISATLAKIKCILYSYMPLPFFKNFKNRDSRAKIFKIAAISILAVSILPLGWQQKAW